MRRIKICVSIIIISIVFCSAGSIVFSEVKNTKAGSKAYSGPKKRIAVMDFEDKVPRTYERTGLLGALFVGNSDEANVGTGMSDMLTTALVKSGYFIVVERKNLEDVLAEQKLGASGLIKDQTAAKIGELVGAQILIRGSVTEFQEKTGEGGGNVGFGGFGIGVKTASAHVAIDMKLYDVATGVVIDATTVNKEVSEAGLSLAAEVQGITFGGDNFQKTPIGKAVRGCIQEAVDYITEKAGKIAWQARIAIVKNGVIYINMGSESGIKQGDEFSVFRGGEEIVDPDSGLSLGNEEASIGVIVVETVKDKFSTAKPVQGSGFEKNDIVRMK